METVRFARRFRGFDHGALGGYAAGAIAKQVGGSVEVNLRTLPPMERELELREAGEGLDLYDGATLVLEARPVTFDLDIPTLELGEAEEAGRHLIQDEVEHRYPECFACGPGREAGDGLRIFLGRPPRGDGVIGNIWLPDANLSETDELPTEMVWAALDCPAIWSSWSGEAEMFPVLARQRLEIHAPVPLGERTIVSAWPIRQDGRKRFAGAAIHDVSGSLLARCEALLVLVPTPG